MLRRIWLMLLLVWVFLPVTGCTTLDGGGPVPSFDIEVDLKELETHFSSDVAIKTLYEGGVTSAKRDKMITGRLVMMNLRYLQFIKSLNAEKQFIDTASDILVLSLNIAGTALTGETVRTVLSASSAAVVGSKTAVDKHYYYEKSMPALVATMNAQRKLVFVSILRGVSKPLEVYPVEQAITDLDMYYHAGTLIGAINAINLTAGEQEKVANEDIKNVTRARINALVSPTAREQVKSIGDAIDKNTDFAKAKAVLVTLGDDLKNVNNNNDARKLLIAGLRERRYDDVKVKEMYDAFKDNGLL